MWNYLFVGLVLLFLCKSFEVELEDCDLKAIYRYLKTIEPVNNPESGKTTAPEQEAAL